MKTFLLMVFALGYAGIIFEHRLKINKAAIALFMAILSWTAFFFCLKDPFLIKHHLQQFNIHLAHIAQIIFFLLGAMTIVELIDSHKGFTIITRLIRTQSKRKLLWLVAGFSFCLSAILDNLTTTILMVSLLRKLIDHHKERFLLCCVIIIAANAGGAWTPIGDVTTTMLWIGGQLSSLEIIKSLFFPSLFSLFIPLLYFSLQLRGKFTPAIKPVEQEEPGARCILILGILGLILVPILKAGTGLPPFMGILSSLSLLWLITEGLHRHDESRSHLRVPHIFKQIDISGILFFLGILLMISALERTELLQNLAQWLSSYLKNLPIIALLIGILSAIIDNIPLVAATMSMYPLAEFPIDHPLWLMIAYAAGTGGSLLIIGSSSGIILMNMEKIEFIQYLKKVSLPVFIGYLIGMGIYLFLR